MHPAGAGSAVKPKSWSLTLGLVEMDRSNESAYPCARVMAIVGLKQLIWTYVDVAKLLVAEIVTPATSEGYGLRSVYKAANLLAGAEMWMTKSTPTEKVESVVLGVAAGSRVTGFDVASFMSTSTHPMCVEEVAADGTVGATLIAWHQQAEQLHPRHDRGGDDGDALQGLRSPRLRLQLRRPRHLPRHGRRPVET